MSKFHIHKDEQQQGPFTLDELRDLKITRETMVWFEGEDNWKAAVEIEELKEIFKSIPPPMVATKNEDETKPASEVNSPSKNNGVILVVLAVLLISGLGYYIFKSQQAKEVEMLRQIEEQKIKISCSIRGISLDDFSGFSKDTTQFKLAHTLRCRIGAHLKKNKTKKNGSAVKDLGCSISELKIHLESKFESWMTWDNYGRFSKNRETWNVDHIKPLSSFNLSDPIQFKQACHYTNLQPMQAYENSVTKSDTINYV